METRYMIEWNANCRIEVIPRFDIEIISFLQGHIYINKDESTQEIPAHLKLVPEGEVEYSFPCRITTNKVDFVDEFSGWLNLEKFVPNYDNLFGKLSIEQEVENKDIDGHINLIGEVNDQYISIFGTGTNEMIGHLKLGTTSLDDSLEEQETSSEKYKNQVFGHLRLLKESVNQELDGTANIQRERMFVTVLNGRLKTERYNVNEDDLDSDTLSSYTILGSINYESDTRVVDIYSHVKLDKTGIVDEDYELEIDTDTGEISETTLKSTNEINGTAKLKVEDVTIDIIEGHLRLVNYYAATEFPCRIKVNKRDYIYSIFARLTVPPQRTIIIPCQIEVTNPNLQKQIIIEGKVSIERESFNQDLATGHLTLLPGTSKDFSGHAYIDPVYTRREFDASINVILEESISFPCTIEVGTCKQPFIENKPCNCSLNGEYPSIYDMIKSPKPCKPHIHFSIEGGKPKLDAHDSSNSISIKESCMATHTIPHGKVIIAVSPTWRYEPFVFKSSLITFLDRYYQKADLALVFGGSCRADFDIINLALNYKIHPRNLHRVPIEIDFQNPFVIKESMDRFIRCIQDFKKDEYPEILRVFMFMNQPSWYYNDPLAALVSFCKSNQISSVAISAGGEYQEICEIDKMVDDFQNNLEWDRQLRFRPNKGYINTKFYCDTNRITY